jgi:tyrosinase
MAAKDKSTNPNSSTPQIVRRNVRSLTPEERRQFVSALLQVKKSGKYDQYIHWHHESMMKPAVLSWEPQDPNFRNLAHRGPVFLPWHREFLRRLEADLRAIDSKLAIPYWDWTEDATLSDPSSSVVWGEDFMGGNGQGPQKIVDTGEFAFKKGQWKCVMDDDGPELRRDFGSLILGGLPDATDVSVAFGEGLYDSPPYDCNKFTAGFRNKLEGWCQAESDFRFTKRGRQLHNRVHLWIGGNMVSMTSPNDPIFFLHHAFIDKIWAQWQAIQGSADLGANYAPVKDGPPGHNLDDEMFPWKGVTPRDLLDHKKLGYAYDDEKIGGQRPEALLLKLPMHTVKLTARGIERLPF